MIIEPLGLRGICQETKSSVGERATARGGSTNCGLASKVLVVTS